MKETENHLPKIDTTLVWLHRLMSSPGVNTDANQVYFGFVNQHKLYTGEDLVKELPKGDMATGLTEGTFPT